uniref:hypothetical protein n=1 Tax=Algoriphagus sp. TaxID=1872435 RepID=UPI0040485151
MKKTTYYHLVLDRSGSMDSCWLETKQVIDKQLLDLQRIQKENPNSQLIFSYCGFNQILQFGERLMPIDQAKMDWEKIFPDGMTSLNDAIGESIHYLNQKAGAALSDADADVVMLILTDGLENSSKQYSPTAIKTLMETCERSGKWNFLFLGAGLEVTEVTNAYARGDRNAMSFSKDNFAASFKEVNNELEDFVKQKELAVKKTQFFKK